MCDHPEIRYCRNPFCDKHGYQTGPETDAAWYCYVCDESVSEQVAIDRGARDPLSEAEIATRWSKP